MSNTTNKEGGKYSGEAASGYDSAYPVAMDDVDLEKKKYSALFQDTEPEDDDEDFEPPDEEPKSDYINSLNAEQKQEEIREGIRTGSLFLIGILAVGVMLVYLKFILIPLVFSRFMVYIFQPVVNLLIGTLNTLFGILDLQRTYYYYFFPHGTLQANTNGRLFDDARTSHD